MKLSTHFARALATLFVVLVAGVSKPAQNPPPCLNITSVTCVRLHSEAIYYTANAVVTGSSGCLNQILTIRRGAGVTSVNPGTISPVTSGSHVSFAFTATGTSATFNYALTGCGGVCPGTVQWASLPTNCPPPCLSLSVVNLSCLAPDSNICKYAFTINVISSAPGTAQLGSFSPVGASVSPSSFPLSAGVNTVSGTLFVPCGTTTVTLSCATVPPCTTTPAMLTVTLPCCAYAAAKDPQVCKGGWTQINLTPPPPSGSTVNWYTHSAPCPTLLPQANLNNGWTGPIAGATLATMGLSQSTCYVALISGPNCHLTSNVVTVQVDTPCSGTIQSNPPGGDVCSGQVVNLSFSGGSGCSVQWQKTIDGGPPQSIGSGLTLPPQTLSNTSKCPFSVVQFQAICTCGVCPPVTKTVTYRVYLKPQVTLTAQKPTICVGDDDVLILSGKICGDVRWLSAFGPPPPPPLPPILNATSLNANTNLLYWNTNQLPLGVTSFQVSVKNGPCPAVLSNIVTITVNGPPTNVTVTPAGPLTFCAPHPVTLTASMQSSLPATCQWYLNGQMIAGATGMMLNATQTGEYCVKCSNQCGTTQSNFVCLFEDKPSITIHGPCGSRGGPNGCITLEAIRDCPAGGCLGSPLCGVFSYQWSASSGPPPTPSNTATVTVCPTGPTTYTVTMTDTCGCTTVATHTVTICNSSFCQIPQPPRLRRSLHATVAAAQESRRRKRNEMPYGQEQRAGRSRGIEVYGNMAKAKKRRA